MRKTFLIFFLMISCGLSAQSWKANPVSLSIFNNATLLPPGSIGAVFTQPIHPGILASYEFGWREKSHHKWFQNVSLGYYYQRYAYQSIQLFSQAGYRKYLGKFSVEGSIHAGYMHLILLTDRAVLQSDGTYKSKQGFGKPQFIAGAGIGAGYNLGNEKQLRRIFLNYDFRLQMPFVKSYVTLLPDGLLSLGMQFNLP